MTLLEAAQIDLASRLAIHLEAVSTPDAPCWCFRASSSMLGSLQGFRIIIRVDRSAATDRRTQHSAYLYNSAANDAVAWEGRSWESVRHLRFVIGFYTAFSSKGGDS